MTPILIFVYNRPYHTSKTFEALSLNQGAETSAIIIYSDGAKDDFDNKQVNEVREICRQIKGFQSVTLIERGKNYGLAENIITGVSNEIKKYGSVIVLEDDLITTTGFINFMNAAILYYRDSDIFSICGYSPNIEIPVNYDYSTYLIPRIGSWGWATWEEKWNQVDWELGDFNSFIRNIGERKRFELGGNDLSMMLLKQKLHKINSWAIRFTFACFKLNNHVVYPVKSLIQNIGIDGSGTHMQRSKKYESTTSDTVDSALFCPIDFQNPEILNQFRLFYSTSLLRRVINMFKLRWVLFQHKRLD